jgi:CspA family cold shock protein
MTTSQTGTVKWFNEAKGYGFIAPDNGSKDLFAHFREIQSTDGYKTLAENARVQFDVTQGAKGPQASNIRPIA